MESNKDESEKCIKIAVDCMRLGDNDKALRFLQKAQRLYSTPRAEVLIDKLTSNLNGAASSGTPDGDSSSTSMNGSAPGSNYQHQPDDGEHVRHRTKSGSKSADVEKSYSPEQLEAVKSVKKCKDYYEILGVSKDCSEDDLKKSYRKMALKLHPDKNHAPGATEAFKAVSNAFAVLSNAEKRQKYDRYGADEDQVSSRRSHADYTRGFEADVTAEELFNMFFGGGFPSSHVRHRTYYTRSRSHHPHYATGDANENNYTFLLQLSPIIFMVLLSILSALFTSDPLYNLERTQKYTVERKTQQLKVPFYVKSDFNAEFKGNMHKLEQEVEEEYVTILKSNCFRERSHKENLLWRARSFGDSALYQRASEIKTPSCDRLQGLYGG